MEKVNILKVENIVKEKKVRTRIANDAKCEVCGQTKEEGKLRRFNEYILCEKHNKQLEKYGKITDPSPIKHKKELEYCCICGKIKVASFDGKNYCSKHYLQISRHGKIFERTIYDNNEYVINDNIVEIKCYDKNGTYKNSTFIDLEDLERVKPYKVYIRTQGSKIYAFISEKENTGKKIFLHRFLMNVHNDKYTPDKVIDHINGDSLDNKKSNLRICNQDQNMKNIHTSRKVTGVLWLKANKKWTARIMFNYKGYHLGNYDNYYEAVLARITKEQEFFNDYGPNKDLYYVINHPSPIEELKKILDIPTEGA